MKRKRFVLIPFNEMNDFSPLLFFCGFQWRTNSVNGQNKKFKLGITTKVIGHIASY